MLHIPAGKYFSENINEAADQWQKNQQPDPIVLPSLDNTMKNANSLQTNDDVGVITVEEEWHVDKAVFKNKEKRQMKLNRSFIF